MPKVLSVQVGPIREHGDAGSEDPLGGAWTSGFYKSPVAGPQRVWAEGIVGDAQADRVNHGGPDKAMLCYALSNYAAWLGELPADVLTPGAFGENLTIDGLDESSVCVGDVYAIGGGVIVEVSQPRQPCWKLGRRFDRRELPERVIETGRTGWYVRVRSVGSVQAGDAVRLIDRPFPRFTIAAMNDMLFFRRPVDPAAATCPALSAGWQRQLGKRLARAANPDSA